MGLTWEDPAPWYRGGACELADEDEGVVLGEGGGAQRECGAALGLLVAQEDGSGCCGAAGEFVVGARVEVLAGGGADGAQDHGDDARGGGVEDGFVEFAFADGADDLRVGASAGGGHFEVETCFEGGDALVDGAPVGDDESFESPFLAEDLREELAVLGGVGAVDLVVGAHDGPGLGFADRGFEGGEVDLAQGALVDAGIDAHAVGLLVVRREVLEGGADALGLDAVDEGGGEFSGQEGVFGEVFEVASAQR